MCSMSVLCPLCAQTSFTSIDALRNSLIKAANGPLACPICNELFLGLDKLTIHLFSHSNLMTHTSNDEPKNFGETKPISNLSKSTTANVISDVVVKTSEKNSNAEKKSKKLKEKKILKIKDPPPTEVQEIINNTNQQKTTLISINQQQQQQQKCSTTQIKKNITTEISQLATCDICEFTFRNEQLRDMHFRLVHQNSPQSIQASNSPIMNTPNATNTLMAATTEPDFKCHLCAKTFKMKGSLRVHLKVVHMMGLAYVNNSPKLGICDRIRHKEIKNHQNSKANITKTIPIQQQSQQTVLPMHTIQQTLLAAPTVNVTNPPNLQLGTLTLLHTQPQQQQQHATDNHLALVPQTIPDASLLNSNVLLLFSPQSGEITKESTNKTNIDNPKIWECDVCAKSFTTKYFLKKHKRLHTGEMPYTCEICARTFTFQQSYHKHLLYHSDEKPHICATCGRAFKELSTLHNHERIHSGEKPFKCEICGKSFRQRVSFLVHTRIHTGVMPYKCEQCDKSFRYKVSLRTHKCLTSTSPTEADPSSLDNHSSSSLPNNNELTNELMTEKFIKSFLESTNSELLNQHEPQHSPASMEIAALTEVDPKTVEELLTQTIDDIVLESCKKMGIGNDNTSNTSKALVTHQQQQLSPILNGLAVQHFSDGSNSPLQRLQDMRLYSPKLDDESGEFSQISFN